MTAFLQRWLALSDRVAVLAVRIAGAMIFGTAILVSVDVIARKVLLMTLGAADELAGYAFAIGTSWALAFTLLRRANVRVDALYSRLPVRVTSILDLFALIALSAFIGYLSWRIIPVLQDSIAFNARSTTPLGTPLWIPQSLWLLGFALFLFAAIPLTLLVFLKCLGGNHAAVHRLAGARSMEEDADEESGHLGHLKAK